jgi:signal peptidase I
VRRQRRAGERFWTVPPAHVTDRVAQIVFPASISDHESLFRFMSLATCHLSPFMMILRWFISKTVRQAVAVRKHVHRLLCAQRDLLSPQAAQAVSASLDELRGVVCSGAAKDKLLKQMDIVEAVANKWLKPYPHSTWRENIEVLLVALAVAMGIRTFFLQPFKIPTGSMQPTLFGVTSENLLHRGDAQIPTGLERVKEWFHGISYVDVRAKSSGTLENVSDPLRLLIFNIKQSLSIGGTTHTIWFPPDCGSDQQNLKVRAELEYGRPYQAGEQVVKLKVQSGDHLFVDRLSYNFRKPTRGEIIVFQTAGIADPRMPQNQFYIKRLVALGGDRVRIGNDRHLVINDRRLDASIIHFENVYSFDPKEPPKESQYSGHVNETVARQLGKFGLAPFFPDENTTHALEATNYMVMGDNTLNSFDSRSWGEFPAANVIGKSFFVYWPITDRFGWGHR